MMEKQVIRFSVKSENGVVIGVSRSIVEHPVVKFGGGTIKWYEDKPKATKKASEKA